MEIGYSKLNEESDSFWDVIIAASAFIPTYGPIISSLLYVGKPAIKVFQKNHDLKIVYDRLSRVGKTEKVSDYTVKVLKAISCYLKSIPKDPEKPSLSS